MIVNSILCCRTRRNSSKEYYPADFEALVRELIIRWYDIGSSKDVKKAMTRLTWRLHSDYKKRIKRSGAVADIEDPPQSKISKSQVRYDMLFYFVFCYLETAIIL